MAATSTEVACPPTPATNGDATAPRKRRRRAPATGAADDCFTCLERRTECDRRRPYCTQCLDLGKDCSGYKTTLTWGVGVASRGKLRGLALPVVEKDASAAKYPSQRRQSNVSETSSVISPTQTLHGLVFETQVPDRVGATACSPTSIQTTFDFVGDQPTPSPSVGSFTSALESWHAPLPQPQWVKPLKHRTSARRRSLRPLQVPPPASYHDYGISKSAPYFGAFSFPAYMSPLDYPSTPDTFAFTAGPGPFYKDIPLDHSPAVPQSQKGFGAWSSDQANAAVGTDAGSIETNVGQLQPLDAMSVGNSLSATLDDAVTAETSSLMCVEEAQAALAHITPPTEEFDPALFSLGDASSRLALTLSRSLPSLSIGKTSRLRYLIDYYDRAIAPFIVAFDGPNNPYRTHVLRLAVESETLQHAIAALASSNIRTREYNNALLAQRKPTAQIAYPSLDCPPDLAAASDGITDSPEGRDSTLTSKPPSPEELHYKRASVQSLNAQLADPLKRRDDDILATLLILCLYHVCDTGVAKFGTQFEGVKMILGMRNGANGHGSKETSWLTTMFTWFDAMTATVNDREGQLQGVHLDVAAFSGDEWALENLAGCDGQLFKIIAKLGRLNLLSQGRPVAERRPQPSCARAAAAATSTVSPRQDYYSLNPHRRFDGNGWAILLDDDDPPPITTTTGSPRGSDTDPSSQTQFWKEWSHIRSELQAWSLPEPEPSPSPTTPTTTESPHIPRGDLLHISESFRHSALIYTERLAHPHLPSLHPNFQNLVAQALYHMTAVQSDVFLLWPLFITGTECVDVRHRALIRQRCLAIQRDSGFFNNISVLDLLERVWRDERQGQGAVAEPCKVKAQAKAKVVAQKFRWRRAMERVEGEYIVI